MSAARHTQGEPESVPTRDGRRLYAMRLAGPSGAKAPTVILEAGSGATRSSWALVQPGVAVFAPAVVYDRSGLGRSPVDPGGRTLDRMADDLVDLIDHYAGTTGVVLTGHSAGGPITRLAASRRPEVVRGLVLVDPTDEGAPVFFGRTFRIGEKVALRAMLALAKVGLLDRPFRAALDTAPAEDVRRDLEAEAFVPGVVRTQIAQSRTFLDELAAWRDRPPVLPDVPVTVISGALAGNGMSRALREQSNESHARRASLAAQGRHVLAPNSGHMVPLTDADLIVEEIRRLVQPAG